jgi:hypothetical protein
MSHYKQLISKPTRVSTTSATIIDLILVSDNDKITQSGVIHTTFNDHSLILCTRKVSKIPICFHNNVTLRKIITKMTFRLVF